ncbi:pseudaminic acid biosynthesis-associated methylase [Gammaproteobacteria bacterium]|nr:pseudaminic acid biosynthesis-associated methylase [Gammaproteobacteria bacterium]MDA8798638.1 pseudaminic acid biosynthesis-associated methylase [Gammaproteobacteria bacterium]MDC0919296.1 pseudaminic acid biosynthesis-associated methylase [Gammaproteobacteria bacterium]
MTKYKTEQENFWAGEFGSDYIDRNQSAQLMASNLDYFSKSLKLANNINSIIEFGANIGMNIRALKLLRPNVDFSAIEINEDAVKILQDLIGGENTFCESILDFSPKEKSDLVLIKGVLIHINPDSLDSLYQTIYDASKKYILIGEYYNPSPVTISYRGHEDRLFKRDFAGDILNKFSDIKLIDYGFVYKNDPSYPQDDITWFLLEKAPKT